MGLGSIVLVDADSKSAHPRHEDEFKNLLKNNVISNPNALFSNKVSDIEKFDFDLSKNETLTIPQRCSPAKI